jgi:hypothetical protein
MKRLLILSSVLLITVSCDFGGSYKSPSPTVTPVIPQTNDEYIAALGGSVYECDFYQMISSRGLIQIHNNLSSVHFQNPDTYRYSSKHSFAFDTGGSVDKNLYNFNVRSQSINTYEGELLFIDNDWSGKYVLKIDFTTRTGEIKLFSIDKNGIREGVVDHFDYCHQVK